MMTKSWKQIILWGIVLYALIFVEMSVLIFVPALAGNDLMINIIHLIILPVLTLFVGWMYFSRNTGDLKEGVKYGFWLLVVASILDIVITVPLFVKSYAEFYSSFWLYLGFLEVLLFSGVAGVLIKRK